MVPTVEVNTQHCCAANLALEGVPETADARQNRDSRARMENTWRRSFAETADTLRNCRCERRCKLPASRRPDRAEDCGGSQDSGARMSDELASPEARFRI